MTQTLDKVMQKREEKLKTALKAMGAGKNKIAEFLRSKKIKGNRDTWHNCPVANYVKKMFPRAEGVEVCYDSISVGFKDDEYIDVMIPKAVSAFIIAFDDGEYVDLCFM